MESFDVLRREATKLERHLEDCVAKYQQLVQRFITTSSAPNNNGGSNNGHNNNGTRHHDLLEAGLLDQEPKLADDITRTIAKMSHLIQSQLDPAAQQTGRSQHLLLVKRYREILYDCSTDFHKTHAAVERHKKQIELFQGASIEDNANNNDSAMDHLLRERNAIGNSLQSAHSVLGQASDIYGDLKTQGSSLRNTHGTIGTIASHVPGLNKVIELIRKKRNRDDMVVSGVIAACILFTLWYVFVA
mmetsp:Transcript_15807/g.15201  ORF Transcript_15807/g.15201 Transcript_15807/m.15201 type:complete len:245 (-) Transcript_15807:11-745(-)|eukprot:CAMPEP_0197825530 /NCGR_PEP_ID=MMETSP1437-20131217/2586_1 /TAXON_ID=49252 ORGANISM="Eucampia antarctica, Strain CCMP1452" /NCGR_SAMPLE_ID=MMETSP1437 /ASSEMBLY_ACC=CAM_ASM_001096 /LENGTH=244 /DNA_ID=CAMNT_0043425551 /DNA_START=255 /DNA_END=989 /DNA_ORIENTATION=+